MVVRNDPVTGGFAVAVGLAELPKDFPDLQTAREILVSCMLAESLFTRPPHGAPGPWDRRAHPS